MKTYLVGGAVRDKLLGRKVSDRDWVVVGATPQEMLDEGYNQVGADFPVFLHPTTNEEYALARTERKTGAGYHGFEANFDPSVTLEDDLIRRDLTINAMAIDPDTDEIIDPHNGQQDLQDGILRHVSDAFAEDPLRVLRVARFAARYDFDVAPETMKLMTKLVNDGEVNHLTPERVWAELEKAVMENYPNRFFWTLQACGAFDVLFPEMERSFVYSAAGVSHAALLNDKQAIRLMLVTSHMDLNKLTPMLDRLRAPTNIISKCRKLNHTRTILTTLNEQIGVSKWKMTPQIALDYFKEVDAYRNDTIMFDIANAIQHMHGDTLVLRMNVLLTAWRESTKINFTSLSKEEQETLKGAKIGKAIDKLRLEKIRENL